MVTYAYINTVEIFLCAWIWFFSGIWKAQGMCLSQQTPLQIQGVNTL